MDKTIDEGMLAVSNKEYDYLKAEATEIKRSINRHIGYIISVTGVSGVIIKYLHIKDNGSNLNTTIAMFISLVALIVITFLFEILFYKFKSHNRIRGYMQLLSQEMFSIELTSEHLFKNSRKRYLIEEFNSQFNPEGINELLFWEFVIARFNNVGDEVPKNQILPKTDKIKFKFSIPSWVDTSKLEDITSMDTDFFKEIVMDVHTSNENRNVFSRKVVSVGLGFLVLFFKKWSRKLISRVISTSVDPKYLSLSWWYPRKVTQIGFLSFLGFSLVFFFCLSSNYDLTICEMEYLPTSAVIIWFLICARWLLTYIESVSHLIAGKYSIDFYCWLFFIYRVQVLNKNRILPEYYCRGFIRYFKSYLILSYVNLNKNEYLKGINDEERELTKAKIEEYIECLKSRSPRSESLDEMHSYWRNAAYEYYRKQQSNADN